MKLPAPSIRKLFRETFSGAQPIDVELHDRPGVMKWWHDQLESLDGVRVTKHPGDRDSRSRTICRFTIPDPHDTGTYWRTNELRLETNDAHELQIRSFNFKSAQQVASVSDFREIELLVRRVLDRYASRRAAEIKREKVRQFKTQAIVASVRKLAEEEGFDFATTSDKTKLRLFVRLSKQHVVGIDIPFRQFDTVLPQLKSTIATLQHLYEQGLRFQIATDRILPFETTWIRCGDGLDP
ncbi:MAG: hypothetical protein AAF670_14980 [Planctomycetota bacterium]